MPREDGLPPGTLVMLILRVLASGPLHGYAIAQRIALHSNDELSVEEGSLYPALQKLLLKGWVKAAPAVSDTGRVGSRVPPHARRPQAARPGAREIPAHVTGDCRRAGHGMRAR